MINQFPIEKALKEIENGENLFFDSETCGLHAMAVLFQWAVDEGPIHLYNVWKEPVWKTLRLIEAFCKKTVIGFNLSFDWFHICKIYTIFRLLDPDWIPEEHINEIAAREEDGKDGPCLKPKSCLDLLMFSRKGPFQSLMGRSDIRIRRVPTQLADALADELEKRIVLDDIYFARSANPKANRWRVYDCKKKDGTHEPRFKDVVLKFSAASGLKYLAEHVLGYKPKYHFKDVEPHRSTFPKELGYAPFANSVSNIGRNWEVYNKKGEVAGYAWPGVVKVHIDHWATREDARDYANDDIVYTRGLYEYFGKPEAGDDDSVLTCMVASIRWKGFRVDLKGIRKLKKLALEKAARSPVTVTKISEVKKYMLETLSEAELLTDFVDGLSSTGKKVLEHIETWIFGESCTCSKCNGEGCPRCNGKGHVVKGEMHPAAIRAKEMLAGKRALKEVELYNKLLRAKRLHASFNVIGTLSSRMSGTDGLNPQGIKRAKEVRSCFPMFWPGQKLSIGDFASFEVTLADAVYSDDNLRSDLMNGTKIHAVFGMGLFPELSYDQIVASDGAKDGTPDYYNKSKMSVFAMFYGGNEVTLARNASVTEEIALQAYYKFVERYPGVGYARDEVFEQHCSLKQPEDGGRVFYQQPADYVESFLGFRRYFTLENKVIKELYDLANNPPKHWRDCKIRVIRREKVQYASGAVQSACFGAAFGVQGGVQRAAANHKIQSPGGEITKHVQRMIWDLQPEGITEFLVMPMNVHDELIVPSTPSLVDVITETIRTGVEKFRPQVPLIGMDWCDDALNWSEKKAGDIKIRCPEMMK